MKIFAHTVFGGALSISSANTSGTSAQYDISEVARVWLQCSATGVNSVSDLSIQLQVSADSINKAAGDSVWINEGSATTFNTTNYFDKHESVNALKARVVVTRNSGAAALTIVSVGKPG